MTEWMADYDAISPHHRYLSDEAVLVQAWKKSTAYMRRHNWYADHLELDLSTIRLQDHIRMWQEQLGGKNLLTYQPEVMRLVPAPKAAPWKFGKKWAPADSEKPLRLRPLAHLSVRDQTAATAVMICLAACVETLQGNPDLPTDAARAEGVVSYGNRLLCDWKDTGAAFRWGNATTYRKYYTDYRRFLQRPSDVVKELERSRRRQDRIAVVQLDLSAFYDRIRRKTLISRLRRYCNDHWPSDRLSPRFWKAVHGVFDWRWSSADKHVLEHYGLHCISNGLPQGLVASGLLANAYMLKFDDHMKDLLRKQIPGQTWKVLDYCRYVDDLRLVLSCSDGSNAESLKRETSEWVNTILEKTAPNQQINPDKTEVTVVGDSSTGIQVAAMMADIQTEVSGPMDAAGAEHVLQALQGLFPLAEQAATGVARSQFSEAPGPASKKLANDILDIFATDIDVRPDTVERFAANRWRFAFRHLRRMTDGAYGEEAPSTKLVAMDERASLFAKRLVRRWMQDPSNVMLLRVAMDVYPTPDLLETVLGLLQTYIDRRKMTPRRRVCLFVAADLLRAGAVETGYVHDQAMLPSGTNIKGYHALLSDFAVNLVCNTSKLPWYVTQQAMLYLASRRHTINLPEAAMLRMKRLLQPYTQLHEALDPKWKPSPSNPSDATAMAVIAHRIDGNTRRFATRLSGMLIRCNATDAADAADLLALSDDELAQRLFRVTSRGKAHKAWRKLARTTIPLEQAMARKAPLLEDLNEIDLLLLDVATHPRNPFHQETAAVHLLLRLIEAWQRAKSSAMALDPDQVVVNCQDWTRLHDPATADQRGFLTVSLKPSHIVGGSPDPRYDLPSYCAKEQRWRISIGRVLRAAITGRRDYTLGVNVGTSDTVAYRGFRSSWYKRQFGLFNRPDALGGPEASISPWLGELLMALLYWPGMRAYQRNITKRARLSTVPGLKRLARRRLRVLAKQYGRASDLPVYETPVSLKLKHARKMTVVTVQTVLPTVQNYRLHKHDLTLSNDPAFRIRHRRHLAAVVSLTEQMLSARGTFNKCTQADLIVFPELSVHPDDLYLLERLMDRTKAMIFCGLVFQECQPGGPLVNRGLWLIPDQGPMGRTILRLIQGKKHMTKLEKELGIMGHRPHQMILRVADSQQATWRLTGAICYDATDLRLAADMRGKTDAFVVPALNKDVRVFDNMAAALHYHMYQHFILANTGEFGGSTVQAPYRDPHERTIVHSHGTKQIAFGIFEMDRRDFRHSACEKSKNVIYPPAGY